MKHATIGDRLKTLMAERNLKQVDILRLAAPYAAEYGVKLERNDLSQYVSGKVTPRKEKLTALARALEVDEAWLLGYDPPSPPHTIREHHTNGKKTLPLLGTIACGSPIYAEENIEEYVDCPKEIDADFCLRCRGDSMQNARICDGDLVYIKASQTVENGEIAAVLVGDEATLKRVCFEKDTVILRPENPAYSPLIYHGSARESLRILGKAVCFLSKVR